jgi:hypothetical protein
MTRSLSLLPAVGLLVLSPAASSARDVCTLEGTALNTTLEKGAAEIAQYYATTAQQLSLNQGGAKGIHDACNWECSSDEVIPSMAKAFGLLKYNCARTTAPASTRRPTGSGTKSQMGLSITDDEYRDAANEIFSGDLMKVPPDLEAASKSGKVKELIEAVDAIPGAEWLKFSSTSVDNDNQGAARILIRVPDREDPKRFEQWIQIAIKDGTGGLGLGRNVDFIAHRLDTDPRQVVFRGYSRTSGGFVPEGGSSSSELTKCYSCHPSGLRPVVPAPEGTRAEGGGKAIKPEGTMLVGGDLDAQLAHVKSITTQLAVFGPTGYSAAENGPRFGPSERAGRPEFVAAGCAKDLEESRRQAIADQMECELCHDGSDRGILTAGTSRNTIYHKVVENTVAPMPPGVTDSLSASERKVMYLCLRAEYAELLKQWLTSDLPMVPETDSSESAEGGS